MTQRRCSATVLAGLIGALLGGCEKEPQTQKPPIKRHNVLLVTLDTTRADRLGCYGHGVQTSPVMDALAADGVRFDLAIAQAAVTPVSHASIFTGLLPPQHGLRVLYAASGYRLSSAVPTLTGVLHRRGWKTGAFLSSFNVSEFFGLDAGFDKFDNGLDHPTDNVFVEQPDGGWMFNVQANQRRADQTTDQAVAWLGQTESPFFLWVHYWDPHDPGIVPPQEIISRFAPSQPTDKKDERRALYDAEVFYVDLQLNRLLQALKGSARYDDTIIVVVADHGQGLGDHDWWAHRLLYQEQLRVPLILRLPGGPRARVVTELVRTIDIYPTVLESLGIASPARVDGRSLLGLIAGRPEPRRLAYADALTLFDLNAMPILRRRPHDDLLHCLMDRSWKLIYKPRRPDQSELYHLETDPGETKNLYAQHPDQVNRLLGELKQLDAFVNEPFGEGQDQEVLGRLRSLGYVGDPED